MRSTALALILVFSACADVQPELENADEPDVSTADTPTPPEPDAVPDAEADLPDPEPTPDPDPLVCVEGQACGVSCVDLDNDPTNCGFCGRTCVLPNADAACDSGACVVGRCDPGFLDVDGDLNNGCETQNACTEGLSCETTCGSAGQTTCVDGDAVCTTPPETCNGVDDDCNGSCDEGALPGCRQGVHRAHGNGHLYTTDLAAAGNNPFRVESQNYFRVYAVPVPGTRPLFLCRKGDGKHLLTSDTACERTGGQVAQLGFWSPQAQCGAVPLYRLYHAPTNNHFYTLSAPERDNARDNLGFNDEGIAGYVWRNP